MQVDFTVTENRHLARFLTCHFYAQVIFDVDEHIALPHPESGIPDSDSSLAPASTTATFVNGLSSAIVYNPYPCLGAPAGSWPRGFPLNATHSTETMRCDVVAGGNETESMVGQDEARLSDSGISRGDAKLKGVIQGLDIGDPDVGALHRFTRKLPYEVEDWAVPEEANVLKVIPEASFTPYNAQVQMAVTCEALRQ